MTGRSREKAKERRRDKRIVDVGMGKKSVSDGLIEEATEEAFDWLERGGLRRLWNILKLIASILAVLVIAILLYIFSE